jgi:predicted XRE-type DNA-binding protein
MKLRSALMMALKDHIARTGPSQSQAAKLVGIPQLRISDLMRGKIGLFGLDTLVNMIGATGLHVEMRISDAAWSKADCRWRGTAFGTTRRVQPT